MAKPSVKSSQGEVSITDYNYLLEIPLWSLCEEKVKELMQFLKEKQNKFNELEK